MMGGIFNFFFFSSRRRHTRYWRDWSSDVCSSDLGIVIPAFARIRISPVIGFILIGLLVGPAGLGSMTGQVPWLHYFTISNAHAIEPFAEFGIILLLFSIGLELSFRRLWNMRRLVFGVGAAELLLSALIIGLGLYALNG